MLETGRFMEALKHICGKDSEGSEMRGGDFPQSTAEKPYQTLFETSV